MPREGDRDRGSHLSNTETVRLGLVGERMAVIDKCMTQLVQEYAALRLELRSGLEGEGDSAREEAGPGPAVHWETLDAGGRWAESQSAARGLDASLPWSVYLGEKLDEALKSWRGVPYCGQMKRDVTGDARLWPLGNAYGSELTNLGSSRSDPETSARCPRRGPGWFLRGE